MIDKEFDVLLVKVTSRKKRIKCSNVNLFYRQDLSTLFMKNLNNISPNFNIQVFQKSSKVSINNFPTTGKFAKWKVSTRQHSNVWTLKTRMMMLSYISTRLKSELNFFLKDVPTKLKERRVGI